jgi:hypothetical protein
VAWRKSKLQKLYDEWIDDIVADKRFDMKQLLDHIHHHTDEGMTEGISVEWLASMMNLIEIIRRKQKLGHTTERGKLERLFLHWKKDPENTTPPPITKSLEKLVATHVEVVQDEPIPITKVVEKPKKEKPKPDPEPNDWYWKNHGS